MGIRAVGGDDKVAKAVLKAVELGDATKLERILHRQEEEERTAAMHVAARSGQRQRQQHAVQYSKCVFIKSCATTPIDIIA